MFLTRTHLAIAMEYAQGGDLFRYVLRHKAARLAESQARWIFQQLVIGLDFCHRSVRTLFAACFGAGRLLPAVHAKPFTHSQLQCCTAFRRPKCLLSK